MLIIFEEAPKGAFLLWRLKRATPNIMRVRATQQHEDWRGRPTESAFGLHKFV
jgi:hypothetical protein